MRLQPQRTKWYAPMGKKNRADAENSSEQKKSVNKGTYELDDMAAFERKMRLEKLNKKA